jgi:hypothetical protein
MTLQQLLILTAAVMLAVLAVTRVVRVDLGLTPHPAGKARIPFVLAFLFLPPVVVEVAVLRPATSAEQLHLIESVLVYLGALVLFTIAMSLAGFVARLIAPVRMRRILFLALVGMEADPYDLPFDPKLSTRLAQRIKAVERANSAFPRGPSFPDEIDRPGFREDWDALDSATTSLEDGIAEDLKLGVSVAYVATDTARDARSRLESLRHQALDEGRAWPGPLGVSAEGAIIR